MMIQRERRDALLGARLRSRVSARTRRRRRRDDDDRPNPKIPDVTYFLNGHVEIAFLSRGSTRLVNQHASIYFHYVTRESVRESAGISVHDRANVITTWADRSSAFLLRLSSKKHRILLEKPREGSFLPAPQSFASPPSSILARRRALGHRCTSSVHLTGVVRVSSRSEIWPVSTRADVAGVDINGGACTSVAGRVWRTKNALISVPAMRFER